MSGDVDSWKAGKYKIAQNQILKVQWSFKLYSD